MRREFPARVRVAAYERSNGHCENCTARLYVGKFHYDHRIPCGLGGEPILGNCVVLCVACHSEKTVNADIPRIAKAVRQQQKHLGARPPKRPWPSRPFRRKEAVR